MLMISSIDSVACLQSQWRLVHVGPIAAQRPPGCDDCGAHACDVYSSPSVLIGEADQRLSAGMSVYKETLAAEPDPYTHFRSQCNAHTCTGLAVTFVSYSQTCSAITSRSALYMQGNVSSAVACTASAAGAATDARQGC